MKIHKAYILGLILFSGSRLLCADDYEVAQNIANTFIAELKSLPDIENIAVLAFEGDSKGFVTDAIKEALLSAHKFHVTELGTLPEQSPKDKNRIDPLEGARRVACKRNIDALLVGEIKKDYVQGQYRHNIVRIQVLQTDSGTIRYNSTKEVSYRLSQKEYGEHKQCVLLYIAGACFLGVIVVRRLAA